MGIFGVTAEPRDAKRAAGSQAYERKKQRESARNRTKSAAGRDIGELPPIADAARRARAEDDFEFFLRTYFPERFPLAWSGDHRRLIAQLQEIATNGGLKAFAMPRGSGKTTLCECAVIWAALTGRRRFIVLIGASKEHADKMLESIRGELESNELLAADFPEVCYPIHKLEGVAQRAGKQLYHGERTKVQWAGATLVLPSMPGSKASAAIICVRGITGSIRGLKFRRGDGETVRPDLAIVDDPQTDKSAKSERECSRRRKVVTGAVLGLAGPSQKMAALMPCTIIEQGDMAAQMLDRTQHAEWKGEISQLIYEWPENEDLWNQYAEILLADMREGGTTARATAFYGKNREAMDKGARVGWEARKNPDELSALQHAMTLKITRAETFDAEYQNNPSQETSDDEKLMPATAIAAKVNRGERAEVPADSTTLTAFIDVQHAALYYLVAAWSDRFDGAVIDYGTFPDQKRGYFTLRQIRRTLKKATNIAHIQAAVLAGLRTLTDELCARDWKRADGATLRLARCAVDIGDGQLAKQVAEVCRTSQHKAVLFPSKGRGIDAGGTPMAEFKQKDGETLGHHYLITTGKDQLRRLNIDTNYWKTFVHERLSTPEGAPGALMLYGQPGTDHRMLSEHCVAEFRKRTRHEKTGNVVDAWKIRPAKPDNHFFDCLVGAACAAQWCGCTLADTTLPRKPKAPPPPRQNQTFDL